MTEQGLDVGHAAVSANLALLLKGAIVRVVADVITRVLTDTTGMALGLQALVNLGQVEIALDGV